MRPRIIKGALLIVAFTTLGALTTGDATSAASRQSAVVWLGPSSIVSTIVQGPVLFTHDTAKMANGEACTTLYLWEPGKTRNEEVASFHCIPTARKAAPKFTLRTEPNLELGFGCILKEYQFAGDTEGPVFRRRPNSWNGAAGTAAARSDRAALADDVRYALMSSRGVVAEAPTGRVGR